MYDFLTLFQHRQLVFANRNRSCTECSDVRSLADGIAEKSNRNACFEITHLDLCFNGRVSLYSGNRYQIHIVKGQLCQLRNHRLNENRCLFRIKAACQIIQRYL